MTDTDIRAALHEATGGLRTPPDLLDRVRAGGRRRVVRRRTLLGAGLATVAAGSTAGAWLSGGDGPQPVASWLLDRPTRGDLRADTGWLNRVRSAWRGHIGGIPVRGEPHVVWTGLAPHGSRVAVVAQRVPQEVASPAGQISYGLTGFLEEIPDGLRALSLEQMLTGAANAPAVLLGSRRNVLMVLDDGRRIEFSPAPARSDDGKVTRTFTPLDFRPHDGVAFAATVPLTTSIRVALRAGVPDPWGDRSVGLANLPAAPAGPGRQVRALPGSGPALAPDGEWDLAARTGYADRYGYHVTPSPGIWYVSGATGDGRRFVVQTLSGTDDRYDLDRLFLSFGTPGKPAFRGHIDAAAPLPVRVRLPDDQGIVVAGPGTLRYRVPRSTWLPVAGDAALLPAAATEAEITPVRGRAVRVPLA